MHYAHRDRTIHIERACQLHYMKMTRHGLLHKGFTSADLDERLNNNNFKALIKKQPNLHMLMLNWISSACIVQAGQAQALSM